MSSTEQCRARTADGERCEHPAGEDGYCHQHDPDDPTAPSVDADGNADGTGGGDGAGGDANSSSDGAGGDANSSSDGAGGDADGTAGDDEPSEATGSADPAGTAAADTLIEVRNSARDVAGDLVEREVDGVVEVRNDDGTWTAVVEVVERHAIPDTQDILGRYEFDFTDDVTATDYRRVDRYRRGESDREEL